MPSIDLARLRKQSGRLADFFFVPPEFARQLHGLLDSYVNYTARKRPALAPGISLPSYRTPAVVIRHIEQDISADASRSENADHALELADRLWDEAWLETRLLAAFLLGQIRPLEGRLVARLTAWTSQVRDPQLRSKLLDAGLVRMRKETPAAFLQLIGEWLRPERTHFWPNAIQASISAIGDPDFINLPPLLSVIEPVVEAAPSQFQLDLEELILALYKASPTETAYFVRYILAKSGDPMTAITFRRMAPSLPADLREEIKDLVQGKPLPAG
jgi:hypothetical protein